MMSEISLLPEPEPLPDATLDVVIIGAGVVGCALARECVSRGLTVAVVEKAVDILDGASKGNSAILHTGFDAPVGSLEQQCIASGYRQYIDQAPEMGLPIQRTGAWVVAWDERQLDQLTGIQDKAIANGVTDCRLHSAKSLASLLPKISGNAMAGLHIPGEHIIDPWTTPLAYLQQAIAGGGQLIRQCEITGGGFDNHRWTLETSRGILRSRLVINCAGLYGDIVNQRLTGDSPYVIKPRKGQFIVFDKVASKLIDTIILPVPEKRTKGVVVCPTIFGNLLVGPTAEEQESRTDSATDHDTLVALQARARDIVPKLSDMPVTATYAGLRPATMDPGYQIRFHSVNNYTDVGGIRSTGLSAALGIARYVADEIEGRGFWPAPGAAGKALTVPVLPALTESAERDWMRPGNGGIVCHCEQVTHREIAEALQGPLAATSLAGLKRRTRVTMGRCQGFYCSAALCAITAGKLNPPMTCSAWLPPT